MTTVTPAGRELDALVAEKVMGWHRMTWREYGALKHPETRWYQERDGLTPCWYTADGTWGAMAEPDDDIHNPQPQWAPSTDIAAAWEVVEKMQGQFPLWTLGAQVTLGTPSSDLVYCQFAASWPPKWRGAAAETAPLAICRAGLAWVERGGAS